MFPTEILENIVKHTDIRTLVSISRTSCTLRALAHREFGRRVRMDVSYIGKMLESIWHNRSEHKFFLTISDKVRRCLCMGCKNAVNTDNHPVFQRLVICHKCITEDPKYTVMLFSYAKKHYHFPSHISRPLFRTINVFSESRYTGYWMSTSVVRDMARKMYNSTTPIPKKEAIYINRKIGVKIRRFKSDISKHVIKKLHQLGYPLNMIKTLVSSESWRKNIPKIHYDYRNGSCTLESDPAVFLRYCISILDLH